MGVRVHDISACSFDWGGMNLMQGLAEDSEILVTETRAERWTQKESGVEGAETVQTRHPGKSGTVQITVDAESALHQRLMFISNQDDLTRNMVATGTLNDGLTGDSETLQGMRIQGRPQRRKGFTASAYAWTFIVARIDYVPGTGIKNLVGEGITPPGAIDEDF
jgi:hypothetical protein